MRAGCSLVVVVMAVACGSGGGERAAPAAPGPLELTARSAGDDDVIVARVDGRPVYGSCVAAQAAGRHVDRATALDDCVTLELLTGAALARGLDRDPALAAAARAAAATRLIDVELRAKVATWDDLPAGLREPLMAKNRERMSRPESRNSWYGRVKVAKAERGGPRDAAAEQAIRAAYAQLGPRADLFKVDLDQAVHAAAAAVDPTLEVEIGEGKPTERDFGLQEEYRLALFAVPAIGQVSAPTRTPWGWDLILFRDFRRPPPLTEAELAAKLFPAARLEYYARWSLGLAQGHAIDVAPEPTLRRVFDDRRGGGAAP